MTAPNAVTGMLVIMLDTLKLGRELQQRKDVVVALNKNIKIALRKGVFIPDDESMYFIGIIKRFVRRNRKSIGSIAEVGIGSGIIAISIAKKFPDIKVYGFDISKKAVELTRHNTLLNDVEVRLFKNKDRIWLDAPRNIKVDLVVSNPPYVSDEEYFSKTFNKEYPDSDYQPVRALRSHDTNGVRAYIEIFKAAKGRKTRYIIFRCNTKSTDKIRQALVKIGCMSVRKLKSSTRRSNYLVVTLLT